MARSLNKATLIGSLGRDPEMRFMPNGNAVCNFSIATDESYNDRNTGQKVEKTEWHRITAYGKLAEIMGQYLKKGSKVYIEGKLQTREWEKDGVKRYTTEIIASEMLMLDSRGGDMGASAPQAGGFQGQSQPNQAASNFQQPQQGGYQAPQQQPAGNMGGYQAPQQAPQPAAGNMANNNMSNNGGNNMGGGYQAPQPPQRQQPQQTPQAQPANAFDDFDDDIPF